MSIVTNGLTSVEREHSPRLDDARQSLTKYKGLMLLVVYRKEMFLVIDGARWEHMIHELAVDVKVGHDVQMDWAEEERNLRGLELRLAFVKARRQPLIFNLGVWLRPRNHSPM